MGLNIQADSNMDGGGSGGGTQSGTTENNHIPGDDGVRITIIDVGTNCRAVGTKTFDYYRLGGKTEKSIIHFGKVCKIEYMGTGGYTTGRNIVQSTKKYLTNEQGECVAYQKIDLPTIVSNSMENSDIDEIKNYFNTENVLKSIASKAGISYENLISGKYKILIEPMIYLTFQGKYIAMTAHEAAKLDIALGGTLTSGGELRAKFVSFTHKNLPLAIFLEKKDLGIKPWTGSKTGRVNNGSILNYLGIGILSFAPEGNEAELDSGSYVYRPDTDVITSVSVSVTGGNEDGATCDNPITVQFAGEYIPTTQVTGITVPQGGERLVWIKWHTPAVSERVSTTIQACITGGSTSSATTTIPIVINPIVRKEPINPTADDRKPNKFSQSINPTFPTTAILSKLTSPVDKLVWHTYTCTKRNEWNGDYYEDEDGNKIKIYETVYDFSRNDYSSCITYAVVKVSPDSNTEGAYKNGKSIRSGYGIEVQVSTNVSGSNATCTGVQSGCVYFPEFNYKTYRRDAKLPGAALQSTLELPVNQYSLNGGRVHFTPIWFPDGEYEVYTELFDSWCPAGMLSYTGKGSIDIEGNLWDDWYIRKVIEY